VLRLKINHKEWIVEGELDPATPLLWVLRDHLGLVG
jgi:aerobic-type carbon monoxide dehydrogenase small subunit (CoxS/CutS family)